MAAVYFPPAAYITVVAYSYTLCFIVCCAAEVWQFIHQETKKLLFGLHGLFLNTLSRMLRCLSSIMNNLLTGMHRLISHFRSRSL